MLLGAWLIFNSVTHTSKPVSTLTWLAAVLTFAAFAIVSGYLGVIGQANCGCFGVIQASPWAAFGVDVTALAVLAVARPIWSGWTAEVGVLKWAGGMAIALALLAGLGVAAYGSLEVAVAKLRGESLGTIPTTLDFGSGKSGELLTTSVTVRNYTDRPVRLIGGTSDCSCITTQDMPVTIEPGESATIGVKLMVPSANTGQLTKRIDLRTDCPNQRTLQLILQRYTTIGVRFCREIRAARFRCW